MDEKEGKDEKRYESFIIGLDSRTVEMIEWVMKGGYKHWGEVIGAMAAYFKTGIEAFKDDRGIEGLEHDIIVHEGILRVGVTEGWIDP